MGTVTQKTVQENGLLEKQVLVWKNNPCRVHGTRHLPHGHDQREKVVPWTRFQFYLADTTIGTLVYGSVPNGLPRLANPVENADRMVWQPRLLAIG